jgi:ribonuclease HI
MDNPGPTIFGGVFGDSNGEIIRIYAGNVAIISNNFIELYIILYRLKVARRQNYSKLIVEWDSQIIINMLKCKWIPLLESFSSLTPRGRLGVVAINHSQCHCYHTFSC